MQVVPEFPGDAEHLSPAPDEVLQDIRDRLEQMREQLPSGDGAIHWPEDSGQDKLLTPTNMD